MTKAAFNSELGTIQSVPEDFLAKNKEISVVFQGNDLTLTVNDEFFEQIKIGYSRIYYWQRDSVMNKRLVITDRSA